jgi:hypothetical protein
VQTACAHDELWLRATYRAPQVRGSSGNAARTVADEDEAIAPVRAREELTRVLKQVKHMMLRFVSDSLVDDKGRVFEEELSREHVQRHLERLR